MNNKIKRSILCLLAVSAMTVTGNIYADDEDAVTAGEEVTSEEGAEGETAEGSTERAKRKEADEKADFDVDLVETYLKKVGTEAGLDIYYKSKDIDDEIWAANGGKPEKKSDYTDEQKELADIIDDVEKLGELVAVDSATGKPAAQFKSGSSTDEGEQYVSNAGRYIVTVDENFTKVIKVREIISSLDCENAFLTDEGKTLDLMTSDNKKVDNTFKYSADENGYAVYKADNGEFAWLSMDKTHYYGAFRYGAEDSDLRMLVDDRNAIFGLENKETGYIWWSAPLGATQDTVATDLLVNELRSSSVLRYGVPANRSNNNVLRSGTEDCITTVSDITNGIRIVYNYQKAGFKFPVEYTIEGDHLKASLKVSEIEETNSSNVATELTLLGGFGAASDKEEGYFVIPDGSGALVRFNNNRTMNSNAYAQRVYGSDVTVVPTTKGSVTEQLYLPCYGIVKDNNAMLVVASKGDSNAVLSTKVSKQSNSSYNLCNFTFILRGTDTFYMSGNTNEELTVFESGKIKSDDIELRYYPIEKEGADYVDVAERYRQYLLEDGGVTVKSKENSAPMYVDLYGGTQKKKPILGIPVTLKQAITRFDEAVEILTDLKNDGVDEMVVSYNNWTNDGIKNKVDTGAKPSGTLGGKGDFKSLTDFMDGNGYQFYPTSDNRDFYSGNGYYSFSSTAVRVSGSYSRIVSYDRAYGIPDGFKKNMSLLSPSFFSDVFGEIGANYSKAGLSGVSLSDLTTSLYGDYGKKDISRAKAMSMLTAGYADIDSKLSNGILADSANAYALPYVSHITGVPLSSSRFDVFDEDIPFYQIVMHGIIPYSTTPMNGDADSETLLLMAAATGSNLSFDMIYEETSTLKDTEFDELYYANYTNWTQTAAAEYKLLAPMLKSVSACTIDDYTVENGGDLVTTTYSDGTVVKVDFEARSIEWNGNEYLLSEFAEEGGVRF